MSASDSSTRIRIADFRDGHLWALQSHKQDVQAFQNQLASLDAASIPFPTWRTRAIDLMDAATVLLKRIEVDTNFSTVSANSDWPCEWLHKIVHDMVENAAHSGTPQMYFEKMEKLHRTVESILDDSRS